MEKNREGKPNTTTSEPKEGKRLLGLPTFLPLENGQFKCVETGHELPAHCRDSYALSKHCRLGLIDSAVSRDKPPLNMFRQDPLSRSKLICKLTGVTVNKSEEHVWKHINGKRFLNMLERKEAEIGMQNEAVGNQDEGKEEKNKDDGIKKKKNKTNKAEEKVNEIIPEERDYTGDGGDSGQGVDFWMPPMGERWDHDDGGDRWGSGSESDSAGEHDAGAEEANHEAVELSNHRTKRMPLEIGPSSFASRKKKKKTIAA